MPLILRLAAVVVVLIGIAAIVGLALVGGNEQKTLQASANEPANEEGFFSGEGKNQETPRPDTEREFSIGDSIEADGVATTLNGVRILPTSDFDRPIENPGNRFLAADLTFENVSEGLVYSLLEFVLKNGERYSASQTIHTRQKELAEGKISPGEKTSGEIFYEVPQTPADSNSTTAPSPRATPTPGASAPSTRSP